MAATRISRSGEKLIASTLYISEKVDSRYVKRAKRKGTRKGTEMIETLVRHKP